MTDDWFDRALREEDSESDGEADANDGGEGEADDGEEVEAGEGGEGDVGVRSEVNDIDDAERVPETDGTVDQTSKDGEQTDQILKDGEPANQTSKDGGTGGGQPSMDDSWWPDDESSDAEDGAELFEDDFATAFEGTDGNVPGFGGGDPTFEMLTDAEGAQSFDDAAVESDIPRITLGIDGLDEMIQGGVPERSLITAIGGAGTGKTTFGLQFLNEGLESGERAIFITLEQRYDDIINTALEMGWAFDEYTERGDLAIVDLDPIEMANSLSSIRNEMSRLVREFGASRLVLDSVSLLEMMYEHRAVRRNEIYDFTHSLKASGVTALLTSEASQETPYASRYGIVEYLTDAVFVLRFIRHSDFQETTLGVEIQKIRNANHSRQVKPYEITNTGISVYRQANIF